MLDLDFGNRVKGQREKVGLTQEQLAKKMGYNSRSSITMIEKGQRNLTRSKIIALANALYTTPSYLVWGDESPEVNKDNFPISFETFSNVFASHGISEKDINDLSPDDQEKLFDLIKQFIKSFKKN